MVSACRVRDRCLDIVSACLVRDRCLDIVSACRVRDRCLDIVSACLVRDRCLDIVSACLVLDRCLDIVSALLVRRSYLACLDCLEVLDRAVLQYCSIAVCDGSALARNRRKRFFETNTMYVVVYVVV